MSSQDHQPLLEGSADADSAATPAAAAGTPRTRRTARSTAEKPGGTRARAAGATSAVAKVATAKAASARAAVTKAAVARAAAAKASKTSQAKPTAVKTTAAKAVAVKTTAAKASKATPVAAKATPMPATVARASATSVPGPAGAKVSAATPVAAGPAATKIAAPAAGKKALTARTAVAARTAVTDSKALTDSTAATGQQKQLAARAPALIEETPTQAAAQPAAGTRTAAAVEARVPDTTGAHAPGGDVAPGVRRGSRGRHRRRETGHRRPAMLLAAALVGALGVGTFAVTNSASQAHAGPGSAVSVAQELGLTARTAAKPAPAVASRQLGLLAASRAQREAEQSAADRAQQVADAKAIQAARPKAVLPVKGATLTSGFGYRWGTLHAGIDLAAPLGTPEYAVMDGVVLKAGPASGFGQAVYIQHANGDVTVYGHMEKILVTTGQVVKAGQEIALLGAEGQATGPHLHLEVHVGGIQGQKIDPIPWLRARGVQI